MQDAARWDAKHRAAAGEDDRICDPFVLAWLDELDVAPGARALDLACGRGRHALELAARGWQTEAWDVSTVALDLVTERAHEDGVVVECRTVDLTEPFPSDTRPFDLIVLVNYLDRDLLSRVHELLKPSGQFVFVTFTTEHGGKRPSPRHCLEPGELSRGLSRLVTTRVEEHGGRAGLCAHLALEEAD